MKRFRLLYLLAFSTLFMLMACQSDDTSKQGEEQRSDGKVAVRLHLSVAGQDDASRLNTRVDENASDDEMMNIWTVYCVDNDPTSSRYGKLVFIHVCMPNDENREIDDLVYLSRGKYAFYSFANINPTYTNSLMGIVYTPHYLNPVNSDGSLGAAEAYNYNSDNPTAGYSGPDFFEISANNTHKGKVYNMIWVENPESDTYEFKYHEMSGNSDIGMYSHTVDGAEGFVGNGLSLTTENCFSSKGIPMSNYQEINITGETDVDLIVVRMVAKIEVQLFNESSTPVTVKSATLSDITEDGPGQICIFPNLNNVGSTAEHQMDKTHQDIRAHIAEEASVGGFTYTPASAVTVPANYKYETNKNNPAHKMVFYVNESAKPKNASGLFYLTLGIDKGGGEVEYRHALISNTTDDEWSYIARNDYRKIPIVLTDWQFRVEPLALAPIAGYPSGTLSSDALTATFSTGGPIALKPYVKKQTESAWRDFSDPEVQFVSVSWKIKGDATENPSGAGKMIMSPFVYEDASKYIIGELNNGITTSGTYETAITVTVKLGPTGSQYTYSFTCNVVLQVL